MALRRRIPLSALMLVAAVVLVGCTSDSDGGGGDNGASGEGGDSSTVTHPEAPGRSGTLDRYDEYEPGVYADPANWVCRPDTADVCDDGLDATTIHADGSTTVEEWQADPDAPVDCFYVYPTISLDQSDVSDRVAGDEERFVTLNQAARLGQVCRVFAPVYRQRTLRGLTSALAGSPTASTTTTTTIAGASGGPGDPGYTDVLDAFRTYMASDNDGRGVVLIGHSQGASVLNRLMREEIDPNPDVRDSLVAAYLAGSSVRVPEGADSGGDFAQIPLCSEPAQTGCVVSWASFRQNEPPPPNALFGRPRSGEGSSACNSPAALSGGSAALRSYFPSDPSSSILSAFGIRATQTASWVDGLEVTTPFVTMPGFVTGECVSRDGFDYLEIAVHGDPSDPLRDDIGGDLTPAWGLHLQDVNLVMGDIVDLVNEQATAWTSGRD